MSKRTLFVGPYDHYIGSGNITACFRIVRWICTNVQGCEYVQYDSYNREDCRRNVDNIVYFYSSMYARFENIINLMKKHPNAKLYWLFNEYSLALNSAIQKYFNKREYEVITNLSDKTCNHAKQIHIINPNVTAFGDCINIRPFKERKYDLIYYGTYRPDRQQYVNEYFQNAMVSTSPRNVRMFKTDGLNAKFIDRLYWGRTDSTLNNFKYSVYIEDKSLHNSKFSSLADRFYECISNGVVMFFDSNCKRNVELSGYDVDDFFYVENRSELDKKMKIIATNTLMREEYFGSMTKLVEKEKNLLRDRMLEILA